MTRTITFNARLLRANESPRTITVRASATTPPVTLRERSRGSALSFDVYSLVDADGWPATATYTFVEQVTPRPATGEF